MPAGLQQAGICLVSRTDLVHNISDLSMCLPPKLLITSHMIWTAYDWLKQFYSFYMAAIAGITSRCDLSIYGIVERSLTRGD